MKVAAYDARIRAERAMKRALARWLRDDGPRALAELDLLFGELS